MRFDFTAFEKAARLELAQAFAIAMEEAGSEKAYAAGLLHDAEFSHLIPFVLTREGFARGLAASGPAELDEALALRLMWDPRSSPGAVQLNAECPKTERLLEIFASRRESAQRVWESSGDEEPLRGLVESMGGALDAALSKLHREGALPGGGEVLILRYCEGEPGVLAADRVLALNGEAGASCAEQLRRREALASG